ELVAATKALKTAGVACPFTTSWPTWIQFEQLGAIHDTPFATQANGFGGLNAELAINAPLYAKHIQTLVDMQKDGTFRYGGRDNKADGLFPSGECAIAHASSGLRSRISKEATFAWGAAPLPYWPDQIKGEPKNGIIGGAAFWVMTSPKRTPAEYKAVSEFFSYLAKPEIDAKWHMDTGYVPVTFKGFELAKAEGFYAKNPGADVPAAQLTRTPTTENTMGLRLGNLPEIRRMLGLMGVDHTVLCDPSDVWNTPTDGEFRMFDGGTSKAQVEAAINAKATISFQGYSTEKTMKLIKEHGHETVSFNHPMGVTGTDAFLMKVSEITGKPIPPELERERGRLVDAIADSQAHLHGKRFALYGDPDLMLGMTAFLLELGAEPVHVLSTNGDAEWGRKVQALLDASPFGKNCKAYPKADLWHMRSLLFTEKVDFLIGNTYGKYLERDCGTPLIRLGFPIFDRHHHHRFPIWGYQGGLRVLTMLLDEYFEALDANTMGIGTTDYSYDIIR
ncbi:MAG: extracellular solute-binding protein, partial [Zoogloea sp.]|nr:extracellular solute-binding protein [Zoogloea sp.]